jgi:RNA polymerase sigma-70 factor (ECF subfamily)
MANSPASDDAALVARAREGDREAFTELVMHYQVPLFNLALRMVGSRDDAADIAQEAFLRAWEKLRTLKGNPFKSWLFQIAVNLCYDHFRRRKRVAAMPEEGQEAHVVSLGLPVPDPAERAEAGERARIVRDSINGLDPDLRTALILRDVNGLAYEEIAAVIRAPLGTVKSRIARARGHVQERLLMFPELFARPVDHQEQQHER